jgi:hypothetical protein
MEWPRNFQVSAALYVQTRARSGSGVPDKRRVILEIYSLTLDCEMERVLEERSKDRAREKI